MDDELRARLGDKEDSLVERKTGGTKGKVQRAAVAFANSLQPHTSGVIFLGLKDDGTPHGVPDTDKKLREVRTWLSECFPPLPFDLHAFAADSLDLVAVVVWPSEQKPHFTGKAYVRRGAASVDASDDELDRLIAERSSLGRTLRTFVGSDVTLSIERLSGNASGQVVPGWTQPTARLLDVTPHYITVQLNDSGNRESFALARLELEWDHVESRPRMQVGLR